MRLDEAATAGELEALQLASWLHCWATPRGARQWAQLLRDIYADERARAVQRARDGDPAAWGEVRRLAAVIAAVDDDLASRGAVPASRIW